MNPVTVPVRQGILDDTVRFVVMASDFCKRAGDELNVRQAAEKRAADLVPDLVEHMLKTATVTAPQKGKAAEMLSTHEGTLHLLKSAIDKIVALKVESGQVKKAGELGGPAGDSMEKTADELASIPVGARTSMVRESDKPLLRLIGQ